MKISSKNTVVWEAIEWKGMECLSWREENKEWTISSHITGFIEGMPFGIYYTIELDAKWHVQHFLISDLNNPDNVIDLYSDAKGKWFDRDEAISTLEGCLDIDITLTPFTNTIPLRRLDLEKGKRTAIEVLYIRLPEFTFEKVQQYYTKLDDSLYLFEMPESNFSAELPVDENKMVKGYPGLFTRVFP